MKEFLDETQKRQLMVLGINWLIQQHTEPLVKKHKVSKRKIHKVIKRRRMSAAARKAISKRMKQMWAAKRKG